MTNEFRVALRHLDTMPSSIVDNLSWQWIVHLKNPATSKASRIKLKKHNDYDNSISKEQFNPITNNDNRRKSFNLTPLGINACYRESSPNSRFSDIRIVSLYHYNACIFPTFQPLRNFITQTQTVYQPRLTK